jgi:hypothetical protein
MTASFVSFTDVARAQFEAYSRVAWFLFECVEREHRITLKAVLESPPAVAARWLQAMQPVVDAALPLPLAGAGRGEGRLR